MPQFRGPGGRVLLTGASCATGEFTVQRLVARRTPLRLLTRDPEALRTRLQTLLGAETLAAADLQIVSGDLEQPWTLYEALTGCRALLHIANLRHAVTCIRACRALGVRRIVAVGSTRKFTRFPDDIARTVRRGEASLAASGLDWTLVSPTMIYGTPRDRNINRLIALVRRRPILPVLDGGRACIQPVHADDVADALVRVLDDPAAIGRHLIASGPHPIELRAALREIAAATGRTPTLLSIPGGLARSAAKLVALLFPPRRALAAVVARALEDKAFDSSELQTRFGWSPRPFPEGLRQRLALDSPPASPSVKAS